MPSCGSGNRSACNLEITMKFYAHTNLDTIREAVDKIDWDAE